MPRPLIPAAILFLVCLASARVSAGAAPADAALVDADPSPAGYAAPSPPVATRERGDDDGDANDRDANDTRPAMPPRGDARATDPSADDRRLANDGGLTGDDPPDRLDRERARLGAATIAPDDAPPPAAPAFASSHHPGARQIPRERPRDPAEQLEAADRLEALEARVNGAAREDGASPPLGAAQGSPSGRAGRADGRRRDGVEPMADARDQRDKTGPRDRNRAPRSLDPMERRARARTNAEFGATLD